MSSITQPTTIQVYLGPRSYEISIVENGLGQTAPFLSTLRDRVTPRAASSGSALIVSDKNVAPLYAQPVLESLREAGWNAEIATLEPGEVSKNIDVAVTLYSQLVAQRADRQTVVIAVGGGVVGDAAGFVAATYARGLPFVQIPTSLLAMVDSSVGGKVGVNLPQAKNLVGAFHQPLGVYIDVATLKSLPEREYRSGLAEVVKYGVIEDESFFRYLEENAGAINERDSQVLKHIIARSCRLKADVVEQDEFERTGLRAILNYGHTFAHAFEALMGYGELLHGEAVSIGMTHAARLAEKLGRVDAAFVKRQTALLTALGLPTALPEKSKLATDDILNTMRLDKKSVGGQLRFVLPTEMGNVETVKDVPESAVRAVLETV